MLSWQRCKCCHVISWCVFLVLSQVLLVLNCHVEGMFIYGLRFYWVVCMVIHGSWWVLHEGVVSPPRNPTFISHYNISYTSLAILLSIHSFASSHVSSLSFIISFIQWHCHTLLHSPGHCPNITSGRMYCGDSVVGGCCIGFLGLPTLFVGGDGVVLWLFMYLCISGS